jgi:hypothetical protein
VSRAKLSTETALFTDSFGYAQNVVNRHSFTLDEHMIVWQGYQPACGFGDRD